MKTSACALVAFAAFAAAPPLLAHGGQYRGPSNVVPPPVGSGTSSNSGSGNSGGSGNSSGPASNPGPAVPAPSSGSLPTGTSAPANSGPKSRGMALDDDLGRWEFWWEFGKDPFLRLRDAVYAPKRTPDDDLLARGRFANANLAIERPDADDLDKVAQALVDNLRESRNRDRVSGCIVALAKIGRESPNWQLPDLFVPFLRGGDQELRETAALALGIAGQLREPAIAPLVSLVQDNAMGRHLSGDVPVNERTRAFAAYGCGLLLGRGTDAPVCQRLAEPLLAVVAAPQDHGRELTVAAIEALAQLPRRLEGAAGKLLRARIATVLGNYYLRDAGAGDRLLQAHVPTAIAHLLSAADSGQQYWKEVFLADLRAGIDTRAGSTTGRGGNLFVSQSCAIALGVMSGEWNADNEADGAIGAGLLEAYRRHRDQQTRSFALLSIARLGGERARDALLRELAASNKAIEQPWCAVALGVWNARNVERLVAANRPAEHDGEVIAVLTRGLAGARSPGSIAAIAVALGLAGDIEARDPVRAALAANRRKDDVAGYIVLALGLLRDPLATEDIRALLQGAAQRPFVMMQCSRALGLMGDQSVSTLLCEQLAAPDATLVQLSAVSSALGQIGDKRSVPPLLAMLANDRMTDLTRAFAAVALGSLCDKDPMPWNSAYATHTNYRAATETLTDGVRGILDIL